jgi:hypothetical protein
MSRSNVPVEGRHIAALPAADGRLAFHPAAGECARPTYRREGAVRA